MKIAYFDCFSGISGDMIIGTLIDIGININDLQKIINKLNLNCQLKVTQVQRLNIKAKKIEVMNNNILHFNDMENLIKKTNLEEDIKEKSLRIIKLLKEAEENIHPSKTTHYHGDLESTDTLIDIVSAVYGLSLLKVDKILASPLNLGAGFIKFKNNQLLPVPAPATSYILSSKKMKAYTMNNLDLGELTTPTACAILAELAEDFCEMPCMEIHKVGYGAGQKELKNLPNLLRIFLGTISNNTEKNIESLTLIETNIDDMNPQIYDYLIEKLYKNGALEVWLTPVYTKKTRPALILSILTKTPSQNKLMDIVFSETTTLGIRLLPINRISLSRQEREIETKFGKLKVKITKKYNKIIPEYEDCKRIAQTYNLPLIEVYKEIIKKFSIRMN